MLQKPVKPIALLIVAMVVVILMANSNLNQKVRANSMVLNQTQIAEKLESYKSAANKTIPMFIEQTRSEELLLKWPSLKDNSAC